MRKDATRCRSGFFFSFHFLVVFFFSFLFLFMGKLLSQRFDTYVCECMCVWWERKVYEEEECTECDISDWWFNPEMFYHIPLYVWSTLLMAAGKTNCLCAIFGSEQWYDTWLCLTLSETPTWLWPSDLWSHLNLYLTVAKILSFFFLRSHYNSFH